MPGSGALPVGTIHSFCQTLLGRFACETGLDPGFGQNRQRGMARRQVKHRCNLALFCPGAHQFSPPAPAQHKPQTVQQNGFARTGFPGQHVQPRLEGKIQMVDDQQIADFKRTQHRKIL